MQSGNTPHEPTAAVPWPAAIKFVDPGRSIVLVSLWQRKSRPPAALLQAIETGDLQTLAMPRRFLRRELRLGATKIPATFRRQARLYSSHFDV